MDGGIVIRVECACGHRATLAGADLGEDPATFVGWHRLRCSGCGRRGRPDGVSRAWVGVADDGSYRGSYRGPGDG
jgi:hypothetical protein